MRGLDRDSPGGSTPDPLTIHFWDTEQEEQATARPAFQTKRIVIVLFII